MKGSPTAIIIEKAQRDRIPKEQLAERRKWRDERLALLAVHRANAAVFSLATSNK